jgi:serine/threonine-protein kinase
VLTFRCITGELPFQSTALGDLLIKIVTHPLPVPSQRAPGVPEGFDAWWQRAAQRDPDHRYQSAKELVEALGLALNVSVPTNLGQTPMPGTMQKTALWQATVVAEPSTSSGSHPALPFEQSAAGASGPYPAAAMTPPTGYTQAMPAGALPHFHPHAGQRLAESASGSVAGLAAPRRPSNNKTLAFVGAGLGLLAIAGIVVAVAAGSGGDEETGPATSTEPTATEAAEPPPAEPDPPPVADEEEEKTEPAPSATEAAPAPKTPSPPRPLPPPAPKTPPPEPTKAPGTPTTLDVPPPAPPPPTPKSSDPDFGF